MHPWRIILALSVVTLTSSAFAQTCRATSDGRVRPLVELYTSEGCNSCPPADRWLASRFAVRDIRAVPIAFHVDYWDRLGWVDRFASPAYTARQHASMRANRVFVVNTDRLVAKELKVGERVGDRIEIVSGIEAGEPVAMTDVDKLIDGLKVRIEDRGNE